MAPAWAQMPEAPEAPHNNVRRAMRWKAYEYTCEGGTKMSVQVAGDLAKVLFQDRQYLMKQTPAADGARYSDEKLAWWSKGESGFLQEENPEGDGKILAKDCKLDQPAEAPANLISGTVVYLQKMALPPNAVIEVKLQDVSQANLSPKTLAEEKITLGERQLPVLFELKYDPSKIDARHSYALAADVLVDGQVRFTNEKSYPVLTRGHPSHVDVILRPGKPGDKP